MLFWIYSKWWERIDQALHNQDWENSHGLFCKIQTMAFPWLGQDDFASVMDTKQLWMFQKWVPKQQDPLIQIYDVFDAFILMITIQRRFNLNKETLSKILCKNIARLKRRIIFSRQGRYPFFFSSDFVFLVISLRLLN